MEKKTLDEKIKNEGERMKRVTPLAASLCKLLLDQLPKDLADHVATGDEGKRDLIAAVMLLSVSLNAALDPPAQFEVDDLEILLIRALMLHHPIGELLAAGDRALEVAELEDLWQKNAGGKAH